MDRRDLIKYAFVLTVSSVFVACKEEKKVPMKDYSSTTRYRVGVDLNRYHTHAIWVRLDEELDDKYLATYPKGGGYKVKFDQGNTVKWVELWKRSDALIEDNTFDISNIDVRDSDKDHLFFIKQSGEFKEIDYVDTEKLEYFYMHIKSNKTLMKCHQYIETRTEFFYEKSPLDGKVYAEKMCYYNRSQDGEQVNMKNCKPLHKQLRPGEIPYF